MSCLDCKAASTNWRWGGINANCHCCIVRDTALAPRDARERSYAALRSKKGVAAAEAFRDEVNAEFKRVQGLKLRERVV